MIPSLASFSIAVRIAAVCFLLLHAPVRAEAQAAPPQTPAGEALGAYLRAFNSGDRGAISTYIAQYDPAENADGLLAFSRETGGFTLLSIARSTPDAVSFLVMGRGDHLTAYGSLRLQSTAPPKVRSVNIRALPPGTKVDDAPLDEAARGRTIEAVRKQLTDYYVYPDVGRQMIDAVDAHAKRGDYNAITDGNEFASRLTDDLRAVSRDQHLFVGYNPFLALGDAEPHAPSEDERARFRADLQRQNCTFEKAELLPRNIGYLRFDAFPPPEFCAATATAAMEFIAHADALIFDLRGNHGGDPSMVEFLASYLFSEPTHINDLVNRHDNATHQYWTLPTVPGTRFLAKPVYVLTSHETFSGAEEFAYDLQTQKRAVIVGETTGGGAHPVRAMPAGDRFTIGVPVARPVNPVTHKDWEGTGVVPDVKSSAAEALAAAQKLAGEKPAGR